MHDPRQPRALRPRALSVLTLDENSFSRGLISEILRNLTITDITAARDTEMAEGFLLERKVDVMLVSWEKDDSLDALAFVRKLRRVSEDRVRRMPVIIVTSGLTRQFVIDARDAGVDEFLAKPISPAAMKQRLEMVIETPRPFVDCAVYLGPCRRRKNPADYYGTRRRSGERAKDRGTTHLDADEEAAKEPIRIALTQLRNSCSNIRASKPETLELSMRLLSQCKMIAQEAKDPALGSALASFEAYLSVAAPLGQIEAPVINAALGALEQLATLPVGFAEARESVAIALGKAIQKKLAA